jgi:DNA-binding MltR family transcriptional regulator
VVPLETISGFLVAHAHRVTDERNENFILRVYRKANKVGNTTVTPL